MSTMLRALSSLTSSCSLSIPTNQEAHLTLALGTVAVLGASTFLLPIAYRDYRLFKSYGPGGIPNNVLGWLIVRALFQPFKREMFSTTEYEQRMTAAEDQGQNKSFLGFSPEQLAQRAEDDRPAIGLHVVPQRQLTQVPDRKIMSKLNGAIDAFVRRNPHLVKFQPSNLERHANAVFLADYIPMSDLARVMKGEAAHVHFGNDHSLHVVLTPADCKKVIEAGWGQRHGFAGTKAMTFLSLGTRDDLPGEYILIYAPRTEAEIETVMDIVAASVKNMSGREDVR